mmetsp:Transcript_4005/g.9963  ORF Transcript_4005/g.9963 Transcript_4005/m.9963 type:complete len:443 (+) Transcript_4005:552-1880(+)
MASSGRSSSAPRSATRPRIVGGASSTRCGCLSTSQGSSASGTPSPCTICARLAAKRSRLKVSSLGSCATSCAQRSGSRRNRRCSAASLASRAALLHSSRLGCACTMTAATSCDTPSPALRCARCDCSVGVRYSSSCGWRTSMSSTCLRGRNRRYTSPSTRPLNVPGSSCSRRGSDAIMSLAATASMRSAACTPRWLAASWLGGRHSRPGHLSSTAMRRRPGRRSSAPSFSSDPITSLAGVSSRPGQRVTSIMVSAACCAPKRPDHSARRSATCSLSAGVPVSSSTRSPGAGSRDRMSSRPGGVTCSAAHSLRDCARSTSPPSSISAGCLAMSGAMSSACMPATLARSDTRSCSCAVCRVSMAGRLTSMASACSGVMPGRALASLKLPCESWDAVRVRDDGLRCRMRCTSSSGAPRLPATTSACLEISSSATTSWLDPASLGS